MPIGNAPQKFATYRPSDSKNYLACLILLFVTFFFNAQITKANDFASPIIALDTLDCDPGFYQTIGNDGTLVRYEYDGFELGFEIIAVFGFQVNATAYNVLDGYMYCIASGSHRLIRFDTDGNYTDLGVLDELNGNIYVGGFDTKGNYYVMQGWDTEVFKIDVATRRVETRSITTGTTFAAADWAYVERDDKFYGVGGDDLYAFDPNNYGVIRYPLVGLGGTPGGFGGAFSTSNGGLFVSNNQTGDIFLIDLTSLQALPVIGGPSSGINDGASCPCALPPFPAIIPADDEFCASSGIPFPILDNDLASLENIDPASFVVTFDPLFGEVVYDEETGTVIYTSDDPSQADFFVYEICLDYEIPVCAQAVVSILPDIRTSINDNICEGDTLFYEGNAYTEEGEYEFMHPGSNGCDSIINLIIELKENAEFLVSEQICEGSEFEFRGETFTESGIYEFSLQAANECDSIVTLDLVVNPTFEENVNGSICDGEAFEYNGVFFGEPGVFEIPYTSDKGCDSIVLVEVVLKEESFGTFEERICAGDSYTLNDSTYFDEGSYVQVLEGENGCDSTLTFTLVIDPVFESDRIEEICEGEVFTLEDGSTYAEEGDYEILFAAANACDSLVRLSIVFKPTYELEREESICEGETFSLEDGTTYSEEDVYELSYAAANGCDSLVTLTINVLQHQLLVINEFICEGDSYTVGTNVYDQTGNYENLFAASNGCDSLVSLNLEVGLHSEVFFNEQICEGESYVFGNEVLSNGGFYEEILVSSNGCDSIITLALEILENKFTPLEISICEGESYTVGTETYFEEGQYEQTFTASNGCDSLVSLNLSLAPNFVEQIAEKICEGESIEIDGQLFKETGDYEIFIPGTDGCDSIIFLNLIANPHVTSSFEERLCEGETFQWNGLAYEEEGQYEQAFQNLNGCDSIVTLDLSVDPIYENFMDEQLCQGEEVEVNGQYFSQTGLYEIDLQTSLGCDSIIYLDLVTFEHTAITLQEELCQGEEIEVAGVIYNSSGFYINELKTINGCDSTITLDLLVNPIYSFDFEEEICEGESYIFNGTSYENSGLYEIDLLTNSGCDSILTLDLLVKENIQIDLEEVICIGSSYTVGTSVYEEAGSYQDVFTSSNGCDSIVNLNLRVEQIFTTTLEREICRGEIVEVAGEIFDKEGTYDVLIQASNGCDSLITLELQVWDAVTTDVEASICDGESYNFGGQDYFDPGTYILEVSTIHGCDSTVYLNLEVRNVFEAYLYVEICEGEVYTLAGNDYSESGDYEQVLPASNDCDSMFYISLIVHPLPTSSVELYTCIEEEVGVSIDTYPSFFGCDSTVTTTTSLLPPNECFLVAAVAGETLTCDREFGTFTFDISVGTPPFSLTWTGPQTNTVLVDSLGIFILENISPGSYDFEIIDANGNEILLSDEILIHDSPSVMTVIALGFGEYDISCYGEADGAAFAVGVGGTEPYSFLWSNGEEDAEIEGLIAGEYTVTLTDANNCTSVSTVNLIQAPPLEMGLTISEIECFDINSGSIQLSANGGAEPYTFSINGSDPQSLDLFDNLSGGTYDLLVTDANGCEVEEIVWLNVPIAVDVELGEDIYIDLGEGANIQALVNIPFAEIDSIFWSGELPNDCDNCLEQIVYPIITSSYTIVVDDENGCSDVDEIVIHVDRDQGVYIPNVFTPNGDGINDVFMIFGNLEAPPKVNSFHVYDRWGNKMFEEYDFLPNDPIHGWDGTFRTDKQNPGVFVYYAIIEFFDGRKVLYEGDVTLLR